MSASTLQKAERADHAVQRAVSELDAAIGALQSVRASDGDADRSHALARSLQEIRSKIALTAMSVTGLHVSVRSRQ